MSSYWIWENTSSFKSGKISINSVDSSAKSNGTFILSSYVEGDYDETQAITVDGFYTNALEDPNNLRSNIITRYIDVIASEPVYQDWMISEKVYTQEVTMVAQRNKDRVYQSIPDHFL